MGLLLNGYWLEVGLVFASLLLILVTWVKRQYRFFEQRGIPYIKPTFLLGTTWRVLFGLRTFSEEQLAVYKQLKGLKVAGVFQTTQALFIVRDPDIIQRILIKDFSHFHDRGIPIDEETDPLEGHLFFLSGEKWRALRIKLSPTFTSGKLKWMYGQMQACADLLVDVLDKKIQTGKELDIKDTLACFTTDVIGSCVFSYEPESLKNPNNDFRKMSQKIFNPSIYYVLLGVLRTCAPGLFFRLKLQTTPPDVHQFFMGTMKSTLEERRKTGTKRNDFVQLLLQLKEKGSLETDSIRDHDDDHLAHLNDLDQQSDSKIELTDDLLIAQAFVFFVAGFETSATSMSFTLYLLSKHPEIQEKARQEVRRVKEKYGSLTYQALKEMEYLEACFNEALRLYPPIPVIFRVCTKDLFVEEANITFHKGDVINIPSVGINSDPEYYPSPEIYRPERFLEGQGSQPGTFLPFGDGPRICIGKRFAMVEAKLGLASILDRYKLTRSSKTKEPLVLNPRSFVLQPKDGLWVHFSKFD